MAAEDIADFILGRMGISRKVIRKRHQDARGAEAALQRMVLLERLLQRVERAVGGCERLDGGHAAPLRLHRKREAAAHRHAIDQHRAASAYAVFATNMSAGGANDMAQEIGQQEPRLGIPGNGAAVEGEGDAGTFVLVHAAHCKASSTTAGPTRRRRSRRSRAEAWMSS